MNPCCEGGEGGEGGEGDEGDEGGGRSDGDCACLKAKVQYVNMWICELLY